jgi:hypothetical protein
MALRGERLKDLFKEFRFELSDHSRPWHKCDGEFDGAQGYIDVDLTKGHVGPS